MDLVGVIPAAGLATRLYPFIAAKETLPIGVQEIEINGVIQERPKIVSQYIIEAMVVAGVKRIIIITRPDKHDLIRQHLDGKKYGVAISFVMGEPTSMVHSIDLAYEWIKTSTVLMGMPDTIAEPVDGMKYLLAEHQASNIELSLGLFPTSNPAKFGMIKTDSTNNVIYHEDKPLATEATHMWGLAVWEPKFTERLHNHVLNNTKGDEIVFGDIIDELLPAIGRCKAYDIPSSRYYDIGTYDEYKKAIAEV
jgi:glucose-1-phosphate thymidylyltransferase